MMKKLLAAFALLALVASTSFAADPPAKSTLNGTITAINGLAVDITVDGDKPAWVKKGQGIKVAGSTGKITAVAATTVTFNAKKASTLKVGDKVSVEKGPAAPAGC